MNDQDVSLTLDEVLVAFQKSLARANEQSLLVSRNPEFRNGDKPLFAIDSLDIELKFTCDVSSRGGDGQPDLVRVHLGEGYGERSTVRFRVAPRAVEVETRRR